MYTYSDHLCIKFYDLHGIVSGGGGGPLRKSLQHKMVCCFGWFAIVSCSNDLFPSLFVRFPFQEFSGFSWFFHFCVTLCFCISAVAFFIVHVHVSTLSDVQFRCQMRGIISLFCFWITYVGVELTMLVQENVGDRNLFFLLLFESSCLCNPHDAISYSV